MIMNRTKGMTLLELTIAMAILTVVMGMLFSLMLGMSRTADLQTARTTVDDDVRIAAIRMIRDLRQATEASVDISGDRNDVLTYQIPVDADGNGIPLDTELKLELSPDRVLMRDVDDLNQDGVAESQLILLVGDNIVVLANNLLPSEDLDGDGLLGAGEDVNGNGVLDSGLRFEWVADGIHVVLQSGQKVAPQGIDTISSIEQTIVPRN